MRWQDLRRSDNVEDQRGSGGGGRAMLLGGGGIGTLIIILIYAFMGGDPQQLIQQLPQGQRDHFTAALLQGRHIAGQFRRGGEDGVLFRMRIGAWRPLPPRRPVLRCCVRGCCLEGCCVRTLARGRGARSGKRSA